MRLYQLAHARAGDKGNTSDISVIAYDPADYEFLCAQVTAERVAEHFADIARGPVERYELPRLHALKFVLHDALGGGVTRAVNLDAHGKSLSSCLLEMELPRTNGATMSNDATATTTAGQVRGQEVPGGVLFVGIPFAQPPVGPLRLRPPRPPATWTGVRPADTYPPAPAQGGTALAPAGSQVAWANDEDCLYLNLFTPALDGARPVIVWIYGGGFEVGTASLPMTDVAALARATGTVVVAMNYRVGALGWLHLADLGGPDWAGSTNLGLQDQIAALHWVRENIAAFGGDPGNVTVAGESAGAFSIGALLAAPAAAGTFHRAILSSGSTERVFSAETATAIAADLLAALGLSSVKELTDVPVERLLATQGTVTESDLGRRNLPGGRAWGVVLDGSVLPRHPTAAVAAGAAARLPLLVSTNRDETRMFTGQPGFAPADDHALLADIRQAGIGQPAELLAAYRARHPQADLTTLRSEFLTDAVYVVPADRLARAQIDAGGRAYRAVFAADPFGPEVGTPHGMDIAYTFDLLDANGMGNPASHAVRDDLHDAWRRFAEAGDPGWPLYDPEATDNARLFAAPGGMTTRPPHDEVTVHWR
jgi:para-nitrobenzyl esterase